MITKNIEEVTSMVLIDTSIIIDKLRKKENPKTYLLDQLQKSKAPYGISIYTYHEVLQGAKTEKEFSILESYLSSQKIFYLPNQIKIYSKSAKIFFELRRQGITIRSMIDVLIAYTAIYNQIPLLHNDRDFDNIAKIIPELLILE